MIFPRGPFYVIGHAQLIPCVDPEPDALLIMGMCVFECVSVMMRWWATGGTVRLAAWWQRAPWRTKVKWRTPASGAELELGACLSEGRAAEGEQKIAQLRESERQST